MNPGIPWQFALLATHLRTGTDSHRLILIVVARWAIVEDMRPRLVHSRHQQTNAERTSRSTLRALLALVRYVHDQSLHPYRRLVDILMLKALGAHVLAQ